LLELLTGITFSGCALGTNKGSDIFCFRGSSFLGAFFFSEGTSYTVSSGGLTNLLAFFEFDFFIFSLFFGFFSTFTIFPESFTILDGAIGSFVY